MQCFHETFQSICMYTEIHSELCDGELSGYNLHSAVQKMFEIEN